MSFKDDELIELVIEQINSDQETGQIEALYDFIDLIDREEMIIYLGTGLRETALERGIIGKGEVPNDG
jgi:hypothetical protein